MVEFAHPERLFLLTAILIFISVFIFARHLRTKALSKYGDKNLIIKLMPDVSNVRPILKFVFLMLALFFLIFAWARPRIPAKLESEQQEGVELIIALDVSNSMLAEDIKPTRLEKAKLAIGKLLNNLEHDKIGLLVFAGKAYVQVPITADYSAALMFLSATTTNIAPVPGTNIGSAIDLAIKSFSPLSSAGKAIIIITDGEDHEEAAIEAAQRAAQEGIVVHTIGMGSPQGSTLPVEKGSTEFRRDRNGNIILSKLNEVLLQQVAAAGGGVYVRATNSQIGLDLIYEEINKMQKEEYEAKYSDYDELFQYFIAFALFFIVLDILVLEKRNKYLKNLKLFETK